MFSVVPLLRALFPFFIVFLLSLILYPSNPLFDHGDRIDSLSASVEPLQCPGHANTNPPPAAAAAAAPVHSDPLCNFTVISAVSENYFDRLENLVGSIHYWTGSSSPELPIIVFDLGLSASQRAKLSSWKNVQLATFPFDTFTNNLHVYNLFNYAWKLVLTKSLFEWYSYDKFVYLDSGLEVRSPTALKEIAQQIDRHGYWNVQQPNFVSSMTHPLMVQVLAEKLGITQEQLNKALEGAPMCSGGIHGWKRNSEAFNRIVKPAYECGISESCLSPPSTGQDNHRFDQSALSIYFRYFGYSCDSSRLFREWEMFRLTSDERRFNSIHLAARRWHSPKPYTKYLLYKSADQLVNQPASGPRNELFDPVLTPNRSVIAHIDAVKLDSDHPLRLCLQRHANSRWPCYSLILQHRMEAIEEMNHQLSYTQLRSLGDQLLTALVSRLIYPAFYVQTIVLLLVFWCCRELLDRVGWKYSAPIIALKQAFRSDQQNEHI